MHWVDELLSAWASGDWSDIARELGYPSTSPSFKAVGETHDTPEPFEISAAEIRIVNEAIDWLAGAYPAEYMALCRRYKPAQFGPPASADAYVLDRARTRLSAEIKRRLQQSSM